MICSNKDCAKEFDAKTHNQKYCCDECCRIATNKRIMDKYYEKKAIKNGAKRECKFCKNSLSRYNQSNVCSKCTKNFEIKAKNTVMEIFNELG